MKSVESPAMVKVAETTGTEYPPGGAGGGEGGGEGGGGDGGGGEGASNTCDLVPTPLIEVMVTPSLAESWVVLPSSADIDVWEEASDGTMMET